MRISHRDSPTGSRSLTRRARGRAHLLGFSLSSRFSLRRSLSRPRKNIAGRRSKRNRRRRRRHRQRRRNTHYTQPSSRLIMFKGADPGAGGHAVFIALMTVPRSLEGGRGRGKGALLQFSPLHLPVDRSPLLGLIISCCGGADVHGRA